MTPHQVFRMPILKDLITDVILGGKKKKAPLAGKSKQPTCAKQPALAKQTNHVKEKTSKSSPSKKIHKGKVMKVSKGKRSDHLVDEEDEEPQPASKPQVEDDEYNLQRGIQMSLKSFQAPVDGVAIHEPDSGIIQKLLEVEGKGKGTISDEQAAQSLLDLQKPKKKKEHGKEVSNTVALEERTGKLNEDQAGSDPGKIPESRPTPERVFMEEDQAGSNPGQSHVVQARPNPEPMHEDFVAIMKEILHDQMFKSGSYRSHPEHTALYDAPELSMDHENKEEFNEATAKSRKRRYDDQDPPPPPPKGSNQSKKKWHDSDASASKHPPV
ncbi:hypothetical protein Tco_1431987 [Tanacetum coccineum]